MKLCSGLLCLSKFLKKRQISVTEPHFGKVTGDVRPRLMARWKAHSQLSIHINWTFLLFITVSESRGEMHTAQLFSQGSISIYNWWYFICCRPESLAKYKDGRPMEGKTIFVDLVRGKNYVLYPSLKYLAYLWQRG